MSKRSDAVEYKDFDSLHAMFPFMMPNRTEAEVSLQEEFDVTDLLKYVEKRRANGDDFKLFHAVCYAISKTVFLRPKLNIFISGKKYWMRKDILISFVAKQKFADNADERLVFLKVKPEMTVNEVSHIVLGDVKKVKEGGSNDLGDTMDFVAKLPRFVKTFIFWVIKKLEYYGKVPNFLTYGDSNYSTVLMSNLGSINAGAPYHHLNNYGTNSIMITIGKYRTTESGRVMLPMTFILDERIADGFYFAKSLRVARYILENPESLENRIDEPLPVDIEDNKLFSGKTSKNTENKKTANKKTTAKKTTKKAVVKKETDKQSKTKETTKKKLVKKEK